MFGTTIINPQRKGSGRRGCRSTFLLIANSTPRCVRRVYPAPDEVHTAVLVNSGEISIVMKREHPLPNEDVTLHQYITDSATAAVTREALLGTLVRPSAR